MRALVIEDERRLAENIARGLQQGSGFAVDLAFDGEDGLYKAEELIYDVIVLDLMLPLVNGLVGLISDVGLTAELPAVSRKSGHPVENRVGPRPAFGGIFYACPPSYSSVYMARPLSSLG